MKGNGCGADKELHSKESVLTYREPLEELYAYYNHRAFVHPDPLEFLYRFESAADIEVAGLIASSLAYGRVAQILRSVDTVLGNLEYRPAGFLAGSKDSDLEKLFSSFVHRFTTGAEMAQFLINIRQVLKKYGSLGQCFSDAYLSSDVTVLPALSEFVARLSGGASCRRFSLLASPDDGSACKRLNLFLRWMIRRDEVDPGCWDGITQQKLIVPLDTHMFSLGRKMGLTSQRCAGMKAAVEITDSFRLISPEDPVKYDFSLTRLGIRNDDESALLKEKLFAPRSEDLAAE